jgi:hypothetical protein
MTVGPKKTEPDVHFILLRLPPGRPNNSAPFAFLLSPYGCFLSLASGSWLLGPDSELSSSLIPQTIVFIYVSNSTSNSILPSPSAQTLHHPFSFPFSLSFPFHAHRSLSFSFIPTLHSAPLQRTAPTTDHIDMLLCNSDLLFLMNNHCDIDSHV